jgi:type I restriction enzyme S subunit
MIDDLKAYSAYRDSGIPWLGEMPEHWRVERAKRLFRKMERPVREDDDVVTCFRDGVVTLRKNRRTRGFTESLKEIGYQGIRRGDLVIHGMDAFAGAIGVSDSDGKGTPVYSVCSPFPGMNPHYYASVVREMARNRWILALSKGIRERSTDFRFETFAAQPVPVPPAAEQELIARFITHVDLRILRVLLTKQKLIDLLVEQKRVMIQRAVTCGLDETAPRRDSGLQWQGDIPAHWDVLALKRVLERLIDCEHKTAPAVDSGDFLVVRTTAVRHGQLRFWGTYCTTPDAFEQWTRRGTPVAGDVIFTREAPAGEACVVPTGHKLCLGQRTVLMKLRRDRYDPEFLVHMIYGGPPAHRIRIASQGSTVGHFNMDDIANMAVLAPPLVEQRSIVSALADQTAGLDDAISRAEREISLLREYRTRLIFDVVTGNRDVREVAARLPEQADDSIALGDDDLRGVGGDGDIADADEIAEGSLA